MAVSKLTKKASRRGRKRGAERPPVASSPLEVLKTPACWQHEIFKMSSILFCTQRQKSPEAGLAAIVPPVPPSSIRTRRTLTGGGAGRRASAAIFVANYRTCPVGLLGRRRQEPGCPTLCWRLASRGGSPGLILLLLSQHVGRERVRLPCIGPQLNHPAGRFAEVPKHVLEFSSFEHE